MFAGVESLSDDGQRAVKDCEADDFSARDVRTVTDALGRKEQRASGVRHAGFLPFAGQDVSPLVRVRMRVRGDCVSWFKFAQHYNSTGDFVFVQNHQLNTFIRTRLPGLVFAQRDVGKHGFTEVDPTRFASGSSAGDTPASTLLFNFRQDLFHLFPPEGAQSLALDVAH